MMIVYLSTLNSIDKEILFILSNIISSNKLDKTRRTSTHKLNWNFSWVQFCRTSIRESNLNFCSKLNSTTRLIVVEKKHFICTLFRNAVFLKWIKFIIVEKKHLTRTQFRNAVFLKRINFIVVEKKHFIRTKFYYND
jgi:hypothetical protein